MFTEGCDCTGNVVAVSTESDGSVLIERDDRAMRFGAIADDYKDCYHE